MQYLLIWLPLILLIVVAKRFISSAIPTFQEGEDLRAKVEQYVLEGNKLHAIHAYRKLTGADLKDSRIAIEARMRGEPLRLPSQRETLTRERAHHVLPSVDSRIDELLMRGEKVAAVKLYRESYRVSLAEAKAAIDRRS